MSGRVTAPQVYRAINSITAALATTGIAKSRTNLKDDYQYRSIDDVLERLAPLLAKHRLCVLPRVIRRECVDRISEAQAVLMSVHVLVAYDLVSSRDGSRHTVRASGEAADPSDKATAKALSAAYKSAMLQTFCIPVGGSEEPDATSHRFGKHAIQQEPVEGWQAWTDGIVDMIGVCETGEALSRVRSRQAALLKSIGRERPDLYARVGKACTTRLKALEAPPPAIPVKGRSGPPSRAQSRSEARHEETIDG